MHVFSRRSCAVALLLAAAALTPAACAVDNSSIDIRGVLQINHVGCTYQLATTAPIQLEGSVDPAYAGEYSAVLLVENQMVPLGNPNTVMTETDKVQLNEAEVQILDTSGNVITSYSVPVAGYIDPSQGGTPGLGAAEVVMLDAKTMEKLAKAAATTAQQVVSTVILQGQTTGNLNVHTQKFYYPITVVAPGSTCAAGMSGPCVGSTTSVMADCALGLDEISNCQVVASQLGICGRLECTNPPPAGLTVAETAVCPAHFPPDNSCCQ